MKEIIPSEFVYPNTTATGSLRLPYWGINGLLIDPPQPPGNFSIQSTADNPDLDGKFNITWTNSEGADSYTIYISNNPLTYISRKFEIHAYQTATSPFSFHLKKGDYYIGVVSYNETGESMSSNYIHLTIPGPGAFSLNTNAGNPDTDGNFDLVWTDSARADNYSFFHHNRYISKISDSLTILGNQTAQTPFPLEGFKSGKYYFTIAAHNNLGYTLSNNINIIVRLTFDVIPIITIAIVSVAGVSSAVLIGYYIKHKKIEKTKKKKHKIK